MRGHVHVHEVCNEQRMQTTDSHPVRQMQFTETAIKIDGRDKSSRGIHVCSVLDTGRDRRPAGSKGPTCITLYGSTSYILQVNLDEKFIGQLFYT